MKKWRACLLVFVIPLLLADTCKKNDVTPCFDLKKLEQRWANAYILVQHYDANNKIFGSYMMHPVGTFVLKSNGSYRVVSDDVPLDGKWQIGYPDCKITLDNGTDDKRTFVIEKLSNDSLIISRKDTLNMVVYIQHYLRN